MGWGYDPDAFWRQTPRRLALILRATADRRDREHDDRMRLAYTTGALVYRAIAGVEFPPLDTLLSSYVPPPPKSPDELKTALRAWLGSPKPKDPAPDG